MKTTERIKDLIERIDGYGLALDKPLLRLWAESLQANFSILQEEHKLELLQAEIRGHKQAATTALASINGSQESDIIL